MGRRIANEILEVKGSSVDMQRKILIKMIHELKRE